jgi:hypothetical protein
MKHRTTLKATSIQAMLAGTFAWLMLTAPVQAGVAGNTYRGILLSQASGMTGVFPCCMSFDADPAGPYFSFWFQGAPQVVSGMYSEIDLGIYSFWMGTDQFGNSYSGFSVGFSFIHVFRFVSNQPGQSGSSIGFTFRSATSGCFP